MLNALILQSYMIYNSRLNHISKYTNTLRSRSEGYMFNKNFTTNELLYERRTLFYIRMYTQQMKCIHTTHIREHSRLMTIMFTYTFGRTPFYRYTLNESRKCVLKFILLVNFEGKCILNPRSLKLV